jgi:hypothetical protein
MNAALSHEQRTRENVCEPLGVSAPIARAIAPRLCRTNPESGISCSWYHGFWQDLRILGLAATPEHQTDFFLGAFARWKGRAKPLKVLISGAADYAILARVAWACNACELAADVTVLDVCETPLFLNRWYAEKFGLCVSTVRCDLLEERPPGQFDVVCSHSFLGQFPEDQRARIVGRWRQFLNQEGAALTVNRIRASRDPEMLKFSPQQAQDFRETLLRRARESRELPQTTPEELVARAEAYIERQYAFAITRTDVEKLFESAGFRIDQLALVTSGGLERENAGALAVPANAQHACVIASKAPM